MPSTASALRIDTALTGTPWQSARKKKCSSFSHARRAWEKLEHFFLRADCHGVPVNAVSIRKALAVDGITLKSPPDYANDVARLRALTVQNLTRLEEHSTLCFGPQP